MSVKAPSQQRVFMKRLRTRDALKIPIQLTQRGIMIFRKPLFTPESATRAIIFYARTGSYKKSVRFTDGLCSLLYFLFQSVVVSPVMAESFRLVCASQTGK